MRYTTIPHSELTISRIILGTWAIGGSNWGPYDEAEALRALETAFDVGVTMVDTAPAYGSGRAEELIGKAIKGRREKVVIATKCGLDINNGFRRDLTPPFLERELENSLRRLNTDCIDLYQPHWPDPDTPMEYTMEALLRFQSGGKIRYIGVSNFTADDLRDAFAFAPVLTLQPPYSLLDRKVEEEIQPFCLSHGVAMLTYGSLGAGMLTGKYTAPPRFKKSDARSFFYPFFQEKYWPRVNALVDRLRAMADEKGVRPGHIAIAWLLGKEGVAGTIVGARSPEQVKDNLGGADCTLAPEEVRELDKLSDVIYECDRPS